MNNKTLNLKALNDYQINTFVNSNNIHKIAENYFALIPSIKKIDTWIKYWVFYLAYLFISLGIIALLLLLTFIALYFIHANLWIDFLIAGIVFAILFLIGYFVIIFSYSIFIKRNFKFLKNKFLFLKNNDVIISDLNLYPDIIQMIFYENEKTKWRNLNKEIPTFSYYGCVIGLIIFFEKLNAYKFDYEKR